MPIRFDKYRFTKRTVLSDEVFNTIFKDIDLRLATLEDLKKDWNEVINEVTRYGLIRIEEILRPAYTIVENKKTEAVEAVSEIQNLRQNADIMINERRDDAILSISTEKTNTLSAISTAKTDALSAIDSLKTDALNNISTAKTDALNSIEQKRQEAVSQIDSILQQTRIFTFLFGGN